MEIVKNPPDSSEGWRSGNGTEVEEGCVGDVVYRGRREKVG